MVPKRLDISTSDSTSDIPPHKRGVVPMVDRDLILQLRSDSVEAFEIIFTRYFQTLANLGAMSLALDVAEDIAQEVLIDLWSRRGKLELQGELRVYLLGATRKKILYFLRKDRNSKRASDSFREVDCQSSTFKSPDDNLERSDFKEFFNRSLRRLNQSQREIVLLRWNQGLTYKEIAGVLGISENAVLKHMGRVRQILRPWFERMIG